MSNVNSVVCRMIEVEELKDKNNHKKSPMHASHRDRIMQP